MGTVLTVKGGTGLEINTQDIFKVVFKDYPDVLNVKQVSALLGVSTKTVYRLLNEGTLVSLKIGRAFRVPKVNVMKYAKIFGSALYE
jgi:excisionase family DNA binding protein